MEEFEESMKKIRKDFETATKVIIIIFAIIGVYVISLALSSIFKAGGLSGASVTAGFEFIVYLIIAFFAILLLIPVAILLGIVLAIVWGIYGCIYSSRKSKAKKQAIDTAPTNLLEDNINPVDNIDTNDNPIEQNNKEE